MILHKRYFTNGSINTQRKNWLVSKKNSLILPKLVSFLVSTAQVFMNKLRRTLSLEIKSIYESSKQIYGAPKIHHQLVQRGRTIGLKLVQKVMHEQGVKSVVNKMFKPARNKSDNIFKRESCRYQTYCNESSLVDGYYLHSYTDPRMGLSLNDYGSLF